MKQDPRNTGGVKNNARLSVAPMMDWTDRHCRYFHRLLSRCALLYTEMVVADAVIHGDRNRLIGYDPAEHPVALQLGGSDPVKLAEAAKIAEDFGYDEINLNVGCPSDRVQSGAFGACLMLVPDLVGQCVASMKMAVSVPVTVKCRIGVDEQEPRDALWEMAERVFSAGADALWVHARKAWLAGLSPKENREVPPLNYDLVAELKRDYPSHFIGLNGGVATLDEAKHHLKTHDGVMLGRAAYQSPALLLNADCEIFGQTKAGADMEAVIEEVAEYADRHIAGGGRLVHVTRHMTGLFHGHAGARQYRRYLSEHGTLPGAGGEVIRKAASYVCRQNAVAA